jgi:hypothetical protein
MTKSQVEREPSIMSYDKVELDVIHTYQRIIVDYVDSINHSSPYYLHTRTIYETAAVLSDRRLAPEDHPTAAAVNPLVIWWQARKRG